MTGNVGAEGDYRNARGFKVGLKVPKGLCAVHIGKSQIEKDEVGAMLVGQIDALPGGGCRQELDIAPH